jgi:hypothetical protein
MNSNVFVDQPEFVDTDPRNQRPEQIAYRIDTNFMQVRHEILLPKNTLKGKKVLDLGSCNAASGAWVNWGGITRPGLARFLPRDLPSAASLTNLLYRNQVLRTDGFYRSLRISFWLLPFTWSYGV